MATREERQGWLSNWLSNWISSLYEFASPAFQRRLWGVKGAIPNCIGSHTELMCGYFDDCNLTEGYEWAIGEGLLSPAEARAADRLHHAADAYDTEYDRDAEYLSDPAWQDVCSLAADAWRRLNGVAGDDVLAEMRRCEETWGAVAVAGDPMSEATLRVEVTNARRGEIRLVVEPWAIEYPMKPGSTYEIEFNGPSSPHPLSVEDRDESVVVYGWVGSVYCIRDSDGTEIDRSDPNNRPPPVP